MRPFITTLLVCYLLFPLGMQAQANTYTSCSNTIPQRGDVVCENGLPQVQEVFDFSPLESRLEIRERLDGFFIPPFLVNLLINVQYRLTGYSVKYYTLDVHGGVAPATGLVVIPEYTGCSLPIVLYDHGTIVGRDQVPSQPDNFGADFIAVLGLAGSGYLTVAPDYVGYGEGAAENHPYLDARTEAAASIDLMRAARKIAEALRVPTSKQTFLTGHSQGGHAAMATLRSITRDFPHEFDVDFAGPSAGAYDLSDTQFDFTFNNPAYPAPELTLLVLAGCQVAQCDANPALDFCNTANVLKPEFIADPYEQFILSQDPNAREAVTLPWQEYFDDNYLAGFPTSDLRNQCLESNNVFDFFNLTPTAMYYCDTDERVTFENAIKARDVQRSNIPWYLFWKRYEINAFDVGDLDHITCALPALYFARVGFNLYRDDCNNGRSNAAPALTSGPVYLYFDTEVDFAAFAGRLTSIELVNFNDQVVRTWSGEDLKTGRLQLFRENLNPGLYGLVYKQDQEPIHYRAVAVRNPQITASDQYDPIQPNPMVGEAKLDLSLLEDAVTQVSIYNLEGVLYDRIFPAPGSQEVHLERKDLIGGSYLVEVRTDRNNYFLPLEIESTSDNKVRLAPNPVVDRTWIEFGAFGNEPLQLELYSADGRLVQSYPELPAGTHRYELQRGTLQAGVYLLKVTKQDGTLVEGLKMIVID